jgi:hypothetical protein
LVNIAQRAYVFALAGKADADNIIPVIWEVSRDGTPCHVVVADASVYDSLQRAWWRKDRPSVEVSACFTHDGPPSAVERVQRLRWNRFALKRFLQRTNAGIVCVQWREGIAHDRAGLARRTIRWWSTGYFTQLQFAARELSIPVVALPHGHSTKTTIIRSTHVRSKSEANSGKLPFADRDSFAAYVFCSDYHRDAVAMNSDMDGSNLRVWGSPRFNDAWAPQLYAQAPAVSLPPLPAGAVRRVLFFVPKWQNLVDRDATMRLIAALGADPRIQLVVRGHLRAEAAALTANEREVLERGNVVMIADDVSSPSLIKACDVVVDVDSSIAFDAVLLGKPYVRPRYLQDASVETVWDRLGGAHQPQSLDATVALLGGDSLAPAARDASFDRFVFGGSGVEVLARYRDELRAIANA